MISEHMEIQYRLLSRSFILITAVGMQRNRRASVIKAVAKQGWETHVIGTEDIHSVNRVVAKPTYHRDGEQNKAIHEWGPLKALGLTVAYSNEACYGMENKNEEVLK